MSLTPPSRRRAWGALLALFSLTAVLLAANPASPASAADSTEAPSCPWMDASKSASQRADELVSAMNLDQKINMVHGQALTNGDPAGILDTLRIPFSPVPTDMVAAPWGRGVGWVAGLPELCVPPLYNADGGQGIAVDNRVEGLGVTAFPTGIAQAATFDRTLVNTYGKALGDQLLGKGFNVSLGPVINSGRIPAFYRNWEGIGGEDPFLQGSLGAAYVTGMQSRPVISMAKHFAAYDGGSGNVIVDERTLRELYEKPFENVVDAGVGSVMCTYSKVNSKYACENGELLSGLKDTMGFRGYVASDWGGTHSTVPSVEAGLDQEMGGGTFYTNNLKSAVESGKVPVAALNGMVRRIVYTMFRVGLFDHPPGKPAASVHTPATEELARVMAQRGTVMLKNASSTLPLKTKNGTIAVIGLPASAPGALLVNQSTTSPDSKVIPSNLSAPLDAITNRAKQDGNKVLFDTGLVPLTSSLVAKLADVAVVFVTTLEGELSFDRTNYTLPLGQESLIKQVAKANPNTIVVVNSGGPVTMPWLPNVKSVLEAWYPGEQDGNAIAGILFGDAEPGGRLPQTFPVAFADSPASTDEYTEGLYTGYRWFDRKQIQPLFPFGFGLTYTTFGYSNLVVPRTTNGTSPATVSLKVRNTGSRTGSDVPQIYVGWPSNATVDAPARQLRGFTRVELAPGQAKTVTIDLDKRAFSYWNIAQHAWTVQPGCYPVWAGKSQRELVLSGRISVGGASCT